MSLNRRRQAELREGVERALAALGFDGSVRAYDAWLDLASLVVALARAKDKPLCVRAARKLAPGPEGFAAQPSDPVWLRIGSDARVATTPLRREQVREENVSAVELAIETVLCCDAPKCEREKLSAEVWLRLASGEKLVCGESLGDAAGLHALAAALAARLGVPLEAPAHAPAPAAIDQEERLLSAGELAHWTLRREGEPFVLRDCASRGPRELAVREFLLTSVLGLGALAAWWWLATIWSAPASWEKLALAGVLAVVLTLATWAAFMIASYSARYRAESEALLSLARDRLVLSPWVSRAGEVDLKPEGRFGAALPLDEVNRLELRQARHATKGGWAIVAETEHGPYQIGVLASREQAQAWLQAIERLLSAVRHGAALALCALALSANSACTPAAPTAPLPSASPSPLESPVSSPRSSAEDWRLKTEDSQAPSAPPAAPSLAIIDDDLARARSEARAGSKVVFVEVWAQWCHTCLSMKSFVLPDPALVPLGEQVVFAAIDSDRPEHADFLEQHEINVWPTLLVLDPKPNGDEVLGLWQGAASVEELRTFLVDAVDARDAAADPAVTALLEAKRAHAKGKFLAAATAYQRALDRGGAGWKRRSDALYGWLFSEYRQGHWEKCAELALAHVAEIEGAAVPTDFSGTALSCAGKVKALPLRASVAAALLARMRQHTDAPPASASVDDRSDALALLSELYVSAGDKAGARRALERQLALLEDAAARAPEPKAAATFDYARMNAYLALGRGDEAVAMLRARTAEFPDNYEPHARLAQALTALKRLSEALAANERAVALSYGQRQLRYLELRADLHAKLGDRAAEREAVKALLAAYDALPSSQRTHPRNKKGYDAAKKRLEQL